jgi:hypothetical protein
MIKSDDLAAGRQKCLAFLMSFFSDSRIRFIGRSCLVVSKPPPGYGALERRSNMGFSGSRAVIMVAVLIVLVLAVTKFGLPGWLLPVGLIATGTLLKGAEKSASGN